MPKPRGRKKANNPASHLVVKAESGDAEALETLQQKYPDLVKVYAPYLGDLDNLTAEIVLDVLIPKSARITRQGVEESLEALREDLGGPDPSPLEKLLVGRVVISWVMMHQADQIYATSLKGAATPKEISHHQKSQDRASRRFLHACRTLAQVRKLLGGPNVQINIGDKQINYAAQGPDPRMDKSR